MCLTDVAHIRKFFNPDALVEIFPDIIERRKNQGNAGIIQNGILFFLARLNRDIVKAVSADHD